MNNFRINAAKIWLAPFSEIMGIDSKIIFIIINYVNII